MSGDGPNRYYGGAQWPDEEPERTRIDFDRPDAGGQNYGPGPGYGQAQPPGYGPGPEYGPGPDYGPGPGYGGEQPPGPPPSAPARKRRRWGRITVFSILGLILVLILATVGTWFWASSKVTKVAALSDYDGRPAQGVGTNWLVVGSDSRSNLTAAQKAQLHVGSDQGQRTDTIMLLHYGSSGPDLVSIPRDSYVTIPAYTDSKGKSHSASKNKINAAYDFGGPLLLTKTVEEATGVRIDHYIEIGFLGVTDVVNSVGGVHMCLDAPVKDHYSGANLPAGCQTLDGTQSLQLIRSRYSLANSDISRMANQQKFVSALAKSVLRPGVVFNPFTLYPFLSDTLGSIAVDNGSGLWDLVQMANHVRPITSGKGTSGTVPIKNEGYQVSGLGSTVQWNAGKANELFTDINHDKPIPTGLLSSLG